MKLQQIRIAPVLGLAAALSAAALTTAPTPAQGAAHLWVINEVFSNDDGTIQFIEMHVPTSAANEIFLNGKWTRSNTTGLQHNFTANLPANSTAFAYILLGTAGFAALPGAPTPDAIIPSNFFDLDHDTIKWWSYVTGDMTFTSGQLPLDGVSSRNRNGTIGVNSPTNFAGEEGSVNANETDAPDEALTAGFFLRVFAPSPSGAVDLEFGLPASAQAKVLLFDASGRVQRRIFDGTADGPVRLVWDGADDAGRRVPSGVYLVQLESNGRQAVRKIAYVR